MVGEDPESTEVDLAWAPISLDEVKGRRRF